MRMLLGLAVIAVGLLGGTPYLRADDRADGLSIVDEAIKAHGGDAALAEAKVFTPPALVP